MTPSTDVTHHMTCLDMQFAIVVLKLELTRVRDAQLSCTLAGADDMCAFQTKWLQKYVTRQKRDAYTAPIGMPEYAL